MLRPTSNRISRPMSQFHNTAGTHSVKVTDQNFRVDQQYSRQTLSNNVEYNNVQSVDIQRGDVMSNPLEKSVRITTKDRQVYEIPNMDSMQAMQLKDTIETQQKSFAQNQNVPQDKMRGVSRFLR